MEPVRRIEAVAAPLVKSNIDTDLIIPSREMTSVGKTGLSVGLFAGWRYTTIGGREPNPDFVLNQSAYAGARILLGGSNFGCGSSREHAVWALHEYGIRAVIAPSFAPIFFGNCVRNGLVPVVLPAMQIAAIEAYVLAAPQQHRVVVDLERGEVQAGDGLRCAFELDAESRALLLEGLDGIALTLKHRDAIDAFHEQDRSQRPWIYATKVIGPSP